MFTGIIRSTTRVASVRRNQGALNVLIERGRGWRPKLGESVAVNGICSTVQSVRAKYFEVEYMPETIRVTTVSDWKAGVILNLEHSLTMSDAIDGHFVQGHIDARGVITKIQKRGSTRELTIQIPRTLRRFIAHKGSVAVDGVSLTIARLHKDTFTVALVSYTLSHTSLRFLRVGDRVNIETDLIARYLARLVKK